MNLKAIRLSIFLLIMTVSMNVTAQKVLVDFSEQYILSQWQIMNDGVMGGLSESSILLSSENHAVFSGYVSLDNNGGFASVRYRFDPMKMDSYNHLVIRIKGDGKRYQLRVKSNASDRHAYISYFQTSGEWQVIKVPLNQMYPTFRGRSLNMPDYPKLIMEELAFLIANKKDEEFRLLIDYIHLH